MTTEATGEQMEWEEAAPAAPKPERQPRQRRQARAAPAEKAPEPPPARAPRKPRAAKEAKERAAPETIKVTLKEFATMRVGEENAKTFIKAHGILAAVGKNARVKVLGELQKVFG